MKKFGTFNGVFIPSYEAILGAVLFLILPFLTAGMGLFRMILIIVIANSATIATAFSISDCTTNLVHVGSGGMFAVSKKSLGKAFGGSIGIQLYLAQALSIGFYVIGFAESLQGIILQIPGIASAIENIGLSQTLLVQIIACALSCIALALVLLGADFVVKIQRVIFVILSLSVFAIVLSPLLYSDIPLFASVNVAAGTIAGGAGGGAGTGGAVAGAEAAAETGAGLNVNGLGLSIGFWGAFAMFFPAVTGIDAGVGMSGQLKDARHSLGRGTFLAIAVTFIIYVLLSIVFSAMDASLLIAPGEEPVSALDLFQMQPLMYTIILLGILFATGSSTLSYLVTAPRTVKALAEDHLLPKFCNFLRRDFRKGGSEPRVATVFTFILFLPLILSGSIQLASTVVGIGFLTVYGWVNLAAFLERISGNPSFRPQSKGHWAISLYGFLICMGGILFFNILIGVFVLLFQIGIFLLLLRYRSNSKLEGVWWGVLFKIIQWDFSHISNIIQGSKNWRPIVRMFAYADRPNLLQATEEMANHISGFKGLTMVNIFSENNKQTSSSDRRVIYIDSKEIETSILSIAQSALPGNFRTNTVLLPMDMRLNLYRIIAKLMNLNKHVLLYREAQYPSKIHSQDSKQNKTHEHSSEEPSEEIAPRIDIWWKGQGNGNFMALLAYIITQSEEKLWGRYAPSEVRIRFLRKLYKGEDKHAAETELAELMSDARLLGEIVILEADEKDFSETLCEMSSKALLVMQGMPGNQQESGIKSLFSLNEYYFSRSFEAYTGMPAMLFVKAAHTISLEE